MPYTQELLKPINSYGKGGFGEFAGTDKGSSLLGGIGAGVDILGSLVDKKMDSNEGSSWQDYDMNADMTADGSSKWGKGMAISDGILDGVSAVAGAVPGVGSIVSLAAKGVKALTGFLPGLFGQASEDELLEEYQGKRAVDAQKSLKNIYASEGDANEKAEGGFLSSHLMSNQIEDIKGPRHEQGGVYLGEGANGKPNIAEGGEFKIGSFIFTDRF